MDAYHVRAGSWLRLRAAVPSGGCVVGACGVGPHLYVVASHAVEISFWRWETGRGRAGGDWARLEPPPLAGQLVGIGSTVWLLCSAFEDGKVVAIVHSTSATTGHGSDTGRRDGEVLLYDIAAGEWTRGPQLPVGFRRAACACVEW
ncbi:hypothetical protein HPP92_018395 [Vanilla planifolia]|uniref:Uncharacterized protein n=1 Tax=Vanilla planifolia TaxID=51239 RepID=A0A835Q9Q3_VANPL|nr:hypothetical protein HPP92_018395 [Vanilla planifolia]